MKLIKILNEISISRRLNMADKLKKYLYRKTYKKDENGRLVLINPELIGPFKKKNYTKCFLNIKRLMKKMISLYLQG